jgi:dynein heavy chain, axonemal
MLIKVLRKTKTIYMVKTFIKETLGKFFIESPPMKLAEVHADSTPTTPIIFVLSPGADPIAYLMALAQEKGMKDKLKTISLGQGQDVIATKMIDEGSKTGLWICFQNCHLYTSWMGEFEKLLEKMDPSLIHSDYRLWLTSDPSTSFPVPILQSGIKLTQEPPRGLKANMANTFRDIGRKRYEEECAKGKEYRKLVFALAYFHSAILERRKYGAIGWNVSYQWMNSDFNCSEQQLMMYLNEQAEVPYQSLNYLVALVNYGGRVTDDKDVRLIDAMLKKYFCPEIMSDAYKLSKLPFYYAPPDGTYEQAMSYIAQLPLDEDPEVFGLHSNANITYETNLVNAFIDAIASVQPRVKGKGNAQTPE